MASLIAISDRLQILLPRLIAHSDTSELLLPVMLLLLLLHLTPTTPIKHIIVIFQENNSFDHYFGTYPHATNPAGESQFIPVYPTPHVNNLEWPTDLLKHNPNKYLPQRLDPHKDPQYL